MKGRAMDQRFLSNLHAQPKSRSAHASVRPSSPLSGLQRTEAEVRSQEAYKRLQNEKFKDAAKEDAQEAKHVLG